MAYSTEAVEKVKHGEEALFSVEAHFHHYLVLQACKMKEEALVALDTAHHLLQVQAANIQDEQFRSKFLGAVPLNARVLKAWQREQAQKKRT